MAIFHLSVKIISRSSGRSAIAAAAYRAGEKLKNEENGKTHDFSKKKGVVYSEIQLPENAPSEYKDRQTLWNKVQEIEKRADAQLAREVEVALPQELDRKKQIELAHNYIQEQFVDKGMIADWSIHDKGDGNPHAHIMLTTRSLKKDGSWAPKQKSTYILDENREKIPQIDPKTGKQKIGARGRKMWKRTTVTYNDWNNRDNVELWRNEWAKQVNHYLEPSKKIDNRSYKRQGITKMPTIHEGYVAREIEKRGGSSDRIETNKMIKKINSAKNNIIILLDKIERMKIRRKQLKQLRERAIKAILRIIRNKEQQYQLFKKKLDEWEEQLNEQFNRQNKRNDGRKRKTSSEDTTIRIRKRGIERRERDFKLREQEMNREVKKRARELIKDEKEELDKKKKQNKRNFNILSAIVVIIGCITLLFSTFILHKANAIATPKKAELASISKIKKENRNLKASISSSERKQAQASSQAAAQKASESQAQAEIAASVKEQSDNDAKIGQLRKEIDELSDSAYPENHMPILPPEEVQRLKANFTRERYNQLLTELEQMKKEKKIGFKDSSDLQSELGLINDSLKKQGK